MTGQWLVRIAMLLMFVIPGVLSLWVGLSGSRWFFESRSTHFWRKYFGLTGARVVYVILGLLLLGCGVVFILDPLEVMKGIQQ